MKFSDLPPGKYTGRIQDWGLESVEKLGKLRVVIKFDIKLESGGKPTWVSGRWDGFLENKDDTPNKKTIATLIICGFSHNDPSELERTDALDSSIDYDLTIERDGEYNRVEWVNLPGEANSVGIKKVKPTKKASAKMKMAFDAAMKDRKAKVKVDEDELGF